MTKEKMSKAALFVACLCCVMAIIVFVFADGLRRWYSGVFFLVIGIVMLLNTFRWRREPEE